MWHPSLPRRRPRRIRPTLAVLALLAVLSYAAPSPRSSTPDTRYSASGTAAAHIRYWPETGHSIGGAFLDYWEAHGGLAQQGYPLTEPFTEVNSLDGHRYTVQYFERTALEWHPENAPPYSVLGSQLGRMVLAQRYPGAGNPAAARVSAPDTAVPARYFATTGHTIRAGFRAYWEAHGGLAELGYPLTEEFAEQSALDGHLYTVQYFERAVLEYHPENQPPYDVLPAQLGRLALDRRYPGGSNPAAQPTDPPLAGDIVHDSQALTCPAFADYARQTGVTDAHGQTHAGSVGMTSFDLAYQFTYNWVLRPGTGETCVQTTQVDVRFTANPRISILDWIPPAGRLSPPCRLDLERYTDAVLHHEQAHVQQITARTAAADARWAAAAPETSCAATQAAAVADLDRQFKTAFDRELDLLKQQIDGDAAAFHSGPAGQPIPFPDCRICP